MFLKNDAFEEKNSINYRNLESCPPCILFVFKLFERKRIKNLIFHKQKKSTKGFIPFRKECGVSLSLTISNTMILIRNPLYNEQFK